MMTKDHQPTCGHHNIVQSCYTAGLEFLGICGLPFVKQIHMYINITHEIQIFFIKSLQELITENTPFLLKELTFGIN